MRTFLALLAGLLLTSPAYAQEKTASPAPPPATAPAANPAPVPAPLPAAVSAAVPAAVPDAAPTQRADGRGASPHSAPLAKSASPAPARTKPQDGAIRDGSGFPFPGAVIGTQVNLRAGPSTNHEVVGRLGDGARLQVISETYGWYGVRANPNQLAVFVHSDLVRRLPSGAAMIARDRVNLRARPSLKSSVVGQSGRGDLVEVQESADGWLAITPPPSVTFYIHRDFVRRVTAGTRAPVAQSAAPAATVDATDLLIEARDLYLAELERDNLDRMDFTRALETYRRALELSDRPDVVGAAHAGIRQIEVAQKLQAAYRERSAALGKARPEPK